MGKHIIIAGRMGSGKTTVERELTARGYRRIVTYTTRPRRRDETQDVDYHFISEEEFLAKKAASFFADAIDYTGSFGHVYFGSARADYLGEDDTVIVLNPDGIETIRTLNLPVTVIYLDVSEALSRERAEEREDDSAAEIDRRVKAENELFARFEKHIKETMAILDAQGVEYSMLPEDILQKTIYDHVYCTYI